MSEEAQNTRNTDDIEEEKVRKPWLWTKGQSGNPGGRPKLPEEIKQLKKESLEKAIEILYGLVNSDEYMARQKTDDKIKLLETVFDRFGLPKVTKTELTGDESGPLLFKWKE
jgi:hypothetical protein